MIKVIREQHDVIRWYALGSLPLDVTKCICQNCKMYFSKLRNDKRYYYYSTAWRNAMICALVITIGCYRVYLSKLENAFVQIGKWFTELELEYFSSQSSVSRAISPQTFSDMKFFSQEIEKVKVTSSSIFISVEFILRTWKMGNTGSISFNVCADN